MIGLVGSVHCVGMCGPIVLALPGQSIGSPVVYFLSRLLYNLGRVATYSFMGAVAGVIGKSISIGGYQQIVSIIMGVGILIAVLTPNKAINRLIKLPGVDSLKENIKSLWLKYFDNPSLRSLFIIGVLNGFLPCGFVYLGLAGAISTGGFASSILYMALFGLGTVPILIATSYAGKVLGIGIRRYINRLIPIGAVIIALLFILRGLSLGIPYISPKGKVLQVKSEVHQMHQ